MKLKKDSHANVLKLEEQLVTSYLKKEPASRREALFEQLAVGHDADSDMNQLAGQIANKITQAKQRKRSQLYRWVVIILTGILILAGFIVGIGLFQEQARDSIVIWLDSSDAIPTSPPDDLNVTVEAVAGTIVMLQAEVATAEALQSMLRGLSLLDEPPQIMAVGEEYMLRMTLLDGYGRPYSGEAVSLAIAAEYGRIRLTGRETNNTEVMVEGNTFEMTFIATEVGPEQITVSGPNGVQADPVIINIQSAFTAITGLTLIADPDLYMDGGVEIQPGESVSLILTAMTEGEGEFPPTEVLLTADVNGQVLEILPSSIVLTSTIQHIEVAFPGEVPEEMPITIAAGVNALSLTSDLVNLKLASSCSLPIFTHRLTSLRFLVSIEDREKIIDAEENLLFHDNNSDLTTEQANITLFFWIPQENVNSEDESLREVEGIKPLTFNAESEGESDNLIGEAYTRAFSAEANNYPVELLCETEEHVLVGITGLIISGNGCNSIGGCVNEIEDGS